MRIIHYLLLLFIVVPVVELLLLFKIGGAIGAIETYIVIVLTGIIGAYLAKQQGLKILGEIKASLSAGSLPGAEIVDGLIILVAGAVLLTPGFLTDIMGFLLLLPAGRRIFRWWLIKRFTHLIKSGAVKATGSGFTYNYSSSATAENQKDLREDIIDVESKDVHDQIENE